MVSDFNPRKFEGASLNTSSSNSNLKMALQKTLLKKRLKYRHPLPPKTSFCDKTIGSRELIFGTTPIKKCMNNLEFFQPNLRRSSGSHCHLLYCYCSLHW